MANTPSERKRVLVVDDDPGMCELLEEYLSGEGFEVVTASNGHEGYMLALELYPDLLISDERMPFMSGSELLKKLRREPLFTSLPIILLSAHYGSASGARVLALGANEYLPKPFQLDELGTRIQRAMVAPSPASRSVMRGDLQFFSLPDILIMTHQNRQTGLLRVSDSEDAEHFNFLFSEGTLLWVSGPREVIGLKAFNRSLRITEGGFRFTPWASLNRQEWHGDYNVNNVLLGGIQEVDEVPMLLADVSNDTRIRLVGDADTSELDAEGAMAVFASGVSEVTVLELLDASPWNDLEVAKEFKSLLSKGVLERVA